MLFCQYKSEKVNDTLFNTFEIERYDTTLNTNGNSYRVYLKQYPSNIKSEYVRRLESLGPQNIIAIYYDNYLDINIYKNGSLLFTKRFTKNDISGYISKHYLKTYLSNSLLRRSRLKSIDSTGVIIECRIGLPNGDDYDTYILSVNFDGKAMIRKL
jgi:hypothetical protein